MAFHAQELDINLDMMSWDLPFLAMILNGPTFCIAGKAVQVLMSQDAVGRDFRNLHLRVTALK
jgi:hypothetical protein